MIGACSSVTRLSLGLTETSPATHVLPLEMARAKLGSIGLLLPTLEARIIDGEGNDVTEFESGEMALRGPTIMRYAHSKEKHACGVAESGSGSWAQRILEK